MDDQISDAVELETIVDEPTYGIAKTALFYAFLSIAAAAFVVPLVNTSQERFSLFAGNGWQPGVSELADENRRTRVRFSVLQARPDQPCYVYANGRTEGDC
ncbi:MAG: hypothetical protein OXR62_04180 [Ahrensia sp.]|nr:hypothetical protein [Ahrensia sp.]